MPDVPQLAFPPRLSGGQVLEVEQGDTQDVVGQIHLMCLTPYGWLTTTEEARDFGLANQAHLAGGADLDEVERQITTHVPDAVFVLEEDPSALNTGLEVLGIRAGTGE